MEDSLLNFLVSSFLGIILLPSQGDVEKFLCCYDSCFHSHSHEPLLLWSPCPFLCQLWPPVAPLRDYSFPSNRDIWGKCATTRRFESCTVNREICWHTLLRLYKYVLSLLERSSIFSTCYLCILWQPLKAFCTNKSSLCILLRCDFYSCYFRLLTEFQTWLLPYPFSYVW